MFSGVIHRQKTFERRPSLAQKNILKYFVRPSVDLEMNGKSYVQAVEFSPITCFCCHISSIGFKTEYCFEIYFPQEKCSLKEKIITEYERGAGTMGHSLNRSLELLPEGF